MWCHFILELNWIVHTLYSSNKCFKRMIILLDVYKEQLLVWMKQDWLFHVECGWTKRKKGLMMWSFAAIFDFLRRLSGLFQASSPQQTWECNSAASGSSAIFKTHFISLAPPLLFFFFFFLLCLSIFLVWLGGRVEVKLSGVSNNYCSFFSGTEVGGKGTGLSVGRRWRRAVQSFGTSIN